LTEIRIGPKHMSRWTTVHFGGFVRNPAPMYERPRSNPIQSSAVSTRLEPYQPANEPPSISGDVTFMRLPEVKAVTGLGKTSIYELIRDKSFPAPVRLGPRAVAWVKSEVRQWALERVHASRSAA
jgi:predicted DNA-binding transcriptional regulator AlpA